MNYLHKATLLIAASASAFVSCTDDVEGPTTGPADKTRVSFYAEIPDEELTRSSIEIGIDKFTGKWDTSDNIGVNATAPDKEEGLLKFAYDGNAFSGSLTSPAKGAWKYRAFYPYFDGTESGATMAYVPFGGARTQNGNDFNGAYDAMVADMVEYTDAEPGMDNAGNAVRFSMHRLTSIVYLDLSTEDATVKSEKVTSVTLSADRSIAASSLMFKYNLEGKFDPAEAGAKLSDASDAWPSNTITTSYEAGSEPSAADFKTFFNILPGEYGVFTVTARTENHKASFTVNRTGKSLEAGKLYKKENALTGWEELAGPSALWIGDDIDKVHEIKDQMDVRIRILADRGIKQFKVKIESAALTEPIGGGTSLLEEVGLAAEMDLVNPATEQMASVLSGFGFPVGDRVVNQPEATVDISTLVPLILLVSEKPSENHTFTLEVTDNAGNVVTQPIRFHSSRLNAIAYNGDADLWKNTATLTAAVAASDFADTKVQYRIKGSAGWKDADLGAPDADGMFTATINPAWTAGQNAAGIAIHNVDPATGVFARKTYEYQLLINSGTVASGEFSTGEGDIIPNGDMEDAALPCFTENGSKTTTFWGSGNNSLTKSLCTQGAAGDNHYALMQSSKQFVTIAAGNLFTGTFNYASMTGTVKFGQNYTYTARPRMMRVKYHAKVGTVDYNNAGGPLQKGEQDKARIFVAIVDWDSQHTVASKFGFTGSSCTGSWDPEQGPDVVTEGKILGYASMWLTETTAGDELVSSDDALEIHWYDTEAPAPTGSYTIVISCAANAYGDFFNGCTTNHLYADDFEWVY